MSAMLDGSSGFKEFSPSGEAIFDSFNWISRILISNHYFSNTFCVRLNNFR